MTNEDKARDIAETCGRPTYYGYHKIKDYSKEDCFHSAIEMAEWKEQWFMKWLTCNAKFYNKYGCEIDIDTDTLIKDFKQAIKED